MLKKLSIGVGAAMLASVAFQGPANAVSTHTLLCHFDEGDAVGSKIIVNSSGITKHTTNHASRGDYVITSGTAQQLKSQKGDDCFPI